MGICESKANKINDNNPKQSIINYNTTPEKMKNDASKYFQNNEKLNNGNTILNNDVIVSDSGNNPEKVYKKIKLIGEGSFGEVWLVHHKVLGKDFAMKIIERNPYCNLKKITNEIQILKQLDHPNILKILDFHIADNKFYIITDYCSEGELYHEIKKRNQFSEIETAYVIHQLLSAIRYCHKMRIIHRDIKPENVMIAQRESNGYLYVKIIDFGTATIFSEGNMLKNLVGSSYYIAPEVIQRKYDESCDIWSIGVIMYIMLTGVPPFFGSDEESTLNHVLEGKYDTSINSYLNLSTNAKDLIKKLLKYNPNERITAREAIYHQWFQTDEFLSIYQRINRIDPLEVKEMLKNLENYKNDNIIKCAALAYLVHQNTNIPECLEAAKLFKLLDTNHDGKIEEKELEDAYKKYCGMNPKQAAQKRKLIFSIIDADNNGYIETEEFIRACIHPNIFNSVNYLKYAFDYFDTDNSGDITLSEIEAKFFQTSKNQTQNSKKELKKLFDKIDINGDGKISFEEFSIMIKDIINN